MFLGLRQVFFHYSGNCHYICNSVSPHAIINNTKFCWLYRKAMSGRQINIGGKRWIRLFCPHATFLNPFNFQKNFQPDVATYVVKTRKNGVRSRNDRCTIKKTARRRKYWAYLDYASACSFPLSLLFYVFLLCISLSYSCGALRLLCGGIITLLPLSVKSLTSQSASNALSAAGPKFPVSNQRFNPANIEALPG